MSLLILYLQFFKFGALAFGGGFTIFPLLFDTFVTQSRIFTPDAFGNLLSIAQMTPGPVTINIATFVGYLQGGVPAAVVASLGLITPSLLVTGTALYFMKKYQDSWFIQGFLKGAHFVAFVMVLYAAVLFLNISVLDEGLTLSALIQRLLTGQGIGLSDFRPFELGLMMAVFYLNRRGVPMTRLLLGSALVGFLISFI